MEKVGLVKTDFICIANITDILHQYIWAATRDFQQCGILTSVDSDELVQPPFKLRNSKCCSVSSLSHRIFKRQATALIRLRVCAGWSEPLCWAHIPNCWKSHVAAHLYNNIHTISIQMGFGSPLILIYWFVCTWRWYIDKLGIFYANQTAMCRDSHQN